MSWHINLAQERSHDSGMERGYVSRGTMQNLTTSRDKVVETFAMLRYDAIISSGCDDLLKKTVRSPKQREKMLSQISSYIDQAENFYNFARNSDYRSAALLYYYAFLNLAKAAIIMQNPTYTSKQFTHGATTGKARGGLKDRTLRIKVSNSDTVSVFNELYKIQFGKYLPKNKSITLGPLFGYLTDNRVEVQRLVPGNASKVHGCKFFILASQETNKSWVVLATRHGFYPANYPHSYSKFVKNFERFIPSPVNVMFTYEMKSLESQQWSFSHSKQLFDLEGDLKNYPISKLYRLIGDSLGVKIQDDIYNHEVGFLIVDPLNKDGRHNFNEMTAIYSFMFYLSNIVRYYPNEFDVRFAQSTTEGWLIKNFIEASPFTALTHLCSLITGNKYRMFKR